MSLVLPKSPTNLYTGRAMRGPSRRGVMLGFAGAMMLPGSNAQPDQASMAGAIGAETSANFRSLPIAQAGLNARNIPAQLKYIPYFVLITRTSFPQILLPANPARCSYILSGTPGSTALQFSFGYPVPIPGGQFLGMQLGPGENFQESNGSCSTDNIWVWSNNSADEGFAFIGYEGLLAIESLQHQSARAK
jgi:hypothetical protein